jgi:hypothetical protein
MIVCAGAIKQSDRSIPQSDAIAARQINKLRTSRAWRSARDELSGGRHEDRYCRIGIHVRDLDRRYLGLKSLQ